MNSLFKLSLLSFLIFSLTANAQTSGNYKFDFGSKKAADGYVLVGDSTKYTNALGYGFTNNSEVAVVSREVKKSISSDYITSKKPFYFSVKVPEGNYDVKVTLGDIKGTSATTVRAECRRLFLQNQLTKKGQIKEVTFTVHVKDSLIRNGAQKVTGKVRLKSREITYMHWDNQLTIEFSDTSAKVCAVEIIPNTTATTIFLAGNSTVVDQDREPWAAWGQMIPAFFNSSKIAVANYAESGETLKAFKGEKRLEKIWSMSKPGDYLFIEFAHNDQKSGGNFLDPFTTYKQTLKEWIAEARKRKMIPVLVASMHRRDFDSSGHINNTLGDYPEAVRQTAKEENTAIIDLNAMSKTMYEAWGPERSIKAFVHFPANTFPGQDKELKDNTHFTTYGAYQLARCVALGIQNASLPIAKELNENASKFDPSKPLDFTKWYWPLSPLTASVKPDGN